MAKKKVAGLLVDVLAEAGVRQIYGVSGDSLNGITDSIRAKKQIQWIHVRNEEVAAFAAGAEAHLTGSLAVCAGSCGPGNMHLINGLYDCHRSRVPVLAIAAQIPSRELGSQYFQETRPEILFKDCSHYCELISNPAQMPWALGLAIQSAIGQRGVSVITIPGDIELLEAPTNDPPLLSSQPTPPTISPSHADLSKLAELLNRGKKVSILGGAGCAGAHAELIQIADALQAPIVHSLRGKEYIEYDNPFDVGMTGLIGFASGYSAMKSCDMLLMLGTDFPYRQFYPEGVTIAQVDTRAETLGNRCPIELGVLGTVKDTLNELLPMVQQNTDSSFLNRALDDYRKARANLDSLAEPEAGSSTIHP